MSTCRTLTGDQLRQRCLGVTSLADRLGVFLAVVPLPVEAHDRFLEGTQIAMYRVLAIKRDGLTIQHAAVATVPVCPPHLRGELVRMKLNPHVQVVYLPKHAPPVLAFGGVRGVARVSVCK